MSEIVKTEVVGVCPKSECGGDLVPVVDREPPSWWVAEKCSKCRCSWWYQVTYTPDMIAVAAKNEAERRAKNVRTEDDGFLGVRVGVLFSVERDGHAITVANYSFPDGTVHPYIEANETHGGVRGPLRVLALSAAVHLIQNATEAEVFEIGGREP